MKVLIACEFSGIVRDAFIHCGQDAWSCDLLPSEKAGPHFQCDVHEITNLGWDLMIAHPPCTYLAASGAKWFNAVGQEQIEAIRFVEFLWDADIPHICIENPVGVLPTMSKLGKASQYIQPWQFGHDETKKTGLWLRGLPLLESTTIVKGRSHRIWSMSENSDRWKNRSRTYSGIAKAMANQWSKLDDKLLSYFYTLGEE